MLTTACASYLNAAQEKDVEPPSNQQSVNPDDAIRPVLEMIEHYKLSERPCFIEITPYGKQYKLAKRYSEKYKLAEQSKVKKEIASFGVVLLYTQSIYTSKPVRAVYLLKKAIEILNEIVPEDKENMNILKNDRDKYYNVLREEWKKEASEKGNQEDKKQQKETQKADFSFQKHTKLGVPKKKQKAQPYKKGNDRKTLFESIKNGLRRRRKTTRLVSEKNPSLNSEAEYGKTECPYQKLVNDEF